jgi:excisionase family DNA binding protein
LASRPTFNSPSVLQITPRLLTIKEAARYCSCAVWAIREAIWGKELSACKIGRRLLITREDLDEFIDNKLRECVQ